MGSKKGEREPEEMGGNCEERETEGMTSESRFGKRRGGGENRVRNI